MEDVGSYLRYKFDQQIFRRYIRNAGKIPSKSVSLQTCGLVIHHPGDLA